MPERPIRREAIESRPVLSAGHLDWQAAFFGGLSDLAIGMYDQIKKREAVEQFETGRRGLESFHSAYNQELDKNPLQADIGTDEQGPVPKFRKGFENAYADISKRMTNGAAAREFDNLAKTQNVRWLNEAISRAFNTTGEIRKATTDTIHDDILRKPIIGQDPTELDELQKQMEANIVTLRAEGVLTPSEDARYELLWREDREKLHYKWWRIHLTPLPPDLYKKELTKSGLNPDQVRNIEAIRASIKREADAQKDEEQYENARKRFVEVFNNELTDPQVITDDLSQDKLSLPIANSLRNILLEREKPTFHVSNYIKVKNAIADDTLTTTQRLVIFAENLQGLDETTRKSLVGEIFAAGDPADPLNEPTAKHLAATLAALRETGSLMGKAPTEMSLDEKTANELKWLKLSIDLENWLKKNPTATPEQKQKFFKEVLLKPQQEEVAKGILQKAWKGWLEMNRAAWKGFPFPTRGPMKPIPEESLEAAERLRQRIKGEKVEPEPAKEMKLQTAPDVAFDKIWPKLTDKEKSKILTALKNGYTAKEILEALGEK